MANYAFADLSITTTSSADIADTTNQHEVGSAISAVTAGNPTVTSGNNTISFLGIIEQLGSATMRGWARTRPRIGMVYPRGVYNK
jgi:hypothetical protein